MKNLFADTKPTADTEYLASAIIRDAVFDKFRELFGRDPVEKTADAPMKVENARVPSMISDSVDPEIAKILKASAVETSKNASGEIPVLENHTLLYHIVDEKPATIPLASVEEYTTLDTNVSDSVISAVSETADINVEEGVAYVSPALSTISIGILVDNSLLAQEFQYRLEQAGGNKMGGPEKTEVFNALFEDLPGGSDLYVENIRETLMKVVGLSSEVTPENIPEERKAPGPAPEAQSADDAQAAEQEVVTTSLKEAISSIIEENGYGLELIKESFLKTYGDSDVSLEDIEATYISVAGIQKGLDSVYLSSKEIISCGCPVLSANHGKKLFFVKAMLHKKDGGTEFILQTPSGEERDVVSEHEIAIY